MGRMAEKEDKGKKKTLKKEVFGWQKKKTSTSKT